MWNLAKDKNLGIVHSRVRELFRYHPGTGHLLWKVTRRARARLVHPGDVAGYISKSDGYRYVGFDRQEILAHRLIWFYMTGEWPRCQIDHIDRNRDNNRWFNLREATNGLNTFNSFRKDNKSGARGVSWSKSSNRWRVRVMVDGKDILIGKFKELNDAIVARQVAEQIYLNKFKF